MVEAEEDRTDVRWVIRREVSIICSWEMKGRLWQEGKLRSIWHCNVWRWMGGWVTFLPRRDPKKPHPKYPFIQIFLEWLVLVRYSVRYFGDTKPYGIVPTSRYYLVITQILSKLASIRNSFELTNTSGAVMRYHNSFTVQCKKVFKILMFKTSKILAEICYNNNNIIINNR